MDLLAGSVPFEEKSEPSYYLTCERAAELPTGTIFEILSVPTCDEGPQWLGRHVRLLGTASPSLLMEWDGKEYHFSSDEWRFLEVGYRMP